jgi:hypothetical protein
MRYDSHMMLLIQATCVQEPRKNWKAYPDYRQARGNGSAKRTLGRRTGLCGRCFIEYHQLIVVNIEESASLIYDFYGFPGHFYKQKYPNRGSKQLAEQVISLLRSRGINASGTDRGLDHGIWVPFKVAFDSEENPLQIPIVQGCDRPRQC